jgi:hypothetical protein
MRSGRLNTAVYKTPSTALTESASGYYEFEFQVKCMLLAQKLAATRLVEMLVLEVRREWYSS